MIENNVIDDGQSYLTIFRQKAGIKEMRVVNPEAGVTESPGSNLLHRVP